MLHGGASKRYQSPQPLVIRSKTAGEVSIDGPVVLTREHMEKLDNRTEELRVSGHVEQGGYRFDFCYKYHPRADTNTSPFVECGTDTRLDLMVSVPATPRMIRPAGS